LAEVETRQEKAQREGTETELETELKGKIVEYLWAFKKKGRTESTIADYGRKLRRLVNWGVDLSDPEDIKEFLAKRKRWTNTTKQHYAVACDGFLKFLKIPWEQPKYQIEEEIPFIPTEQEIDDLIAGSGKRLAVFLQLLKETAMRTGEAMKLKWTDIDFERRNVRIKPSKGGFPRILPISPRLVEMLKNLPKKSEKVFPNRQDSMRSNFCHQRKIMARKLGNPRLVKIHFHTLRHWRATIEYHKTKDPVHVKEFLGHKSIVNTMIYIHIEYALFQDGQPEEFHVRVAKTPEEIKELLEAGFDYVLQKDNLAYFRKRK
jgi:integrase